MKKKKPYVSVGNNIIWFTGKLFRLAPGALAAYLISIPLAVAMSYAEIYLPALVVREATAARGIGQAALSIGLVLGLMLVGQALGECNKMLIDGCDQSYTNALTSMLNQKGQNLFYQKYEQKGTRDLMERAVSSAEMWDGGRPIVDIFIHLTELIKSVLCYLLFGTMVSMVSPWLLPILTVAPLVNWLSVRAYNHYEYRNREKNKDTSGKIEYLIGQAEDFRAGKDIRIYGMTEWFLGLFRSLDHELATWDRKLGFRRFLSRIADLAVILLRDGAAYLLLISMTLRGEISVDRFVLYFAAISSFATWVGNIIDRFNKLHATSLKLCDLREFMDLEAYQGEGEVSIKEHLQKAPEIVFDHVSFRYEGAEADTLKDLCFTIRAGEKIALVGLNGAGKTTLVKLLCGLYLPTAGEIRVNGIPVQKFNLKEYYGLFSPVFQEVRTGFFTLAQSVSGKLDDTFDSVRVEACMRNAGLSGKLDSLPDGIHTKLDKQLYDDGTELSGGEAQKLMLARALYKDAPMLVLDEPTAALDPIAESRIYETYQQMTAGKTALYISHRLASTRFCDRILYLENGVIAEEGTYEELMQLGGKYSALYEMQSCWYREDYQKGGEEA